MTFRPAPTNVVENIPGICPVGVFWEHATRSGYIEGTWQMMEYMLGTL